MRPNAKWDAQLWEAGRLKALQLEDEIRKSDATRGQKADMLHTLSKLTMFWSDAVYDRADPRTSSPSGDQEK